MLASTLDFNKGATVAETIRSPIATGGRATLQHRLFRCPDDGGFELSRGLRGRIPVLRVREADDWSACEATE